MSTLHGLFGKKASTVNKVNVSRAVPLVYNWTIFWKNNPAFSSQEIWVYSKARIFQSFWRVIYRKANIIPPFWFSFDRVDTVLEKVYNFPESSCHTIPRWANVRLASHTVPTSLHKTEPVTVGVDATVYSKVEWSFFLIAQ